MAKQYKGSLTLEWFNKQKSVINIDESNPIRSGMDIPAPAINWINKDDALFYEISEEEGKGNRPYWVDRNDIRIKEARPLVFQRAYRAVLGNAKGTIPGTDMEWIIKEINNEQNSTDIENTLIKGDNLLALNTLKKHFEQLPDYKKVKCIFIDPPYNTGSAFEQYDDNLAHSEWLTLMRDRLAKLRDLLSTDGSIWITIDDDESHYLKVLCDDVFGRENFVANVVWQKKFSPQNDATWFSDMHDHILVYARNKEIWRPNLLQRSTEAENRYKNPDKDSRGAWISADLTVRTYSKENDYPIPTPSGKIITPSKGRCWGVSKSKFDELVSDNRIWFGENGDNVPRVKKFISEVKDGITPTTLWLHSDVGHNQDAKKEVKEIDDDDVFETPKPEKLLERIIQISTNEGDMVLDCFGGSGTTFSVAHKMNRKWIGIEIGEHADTHIIKRMIGVLDGSQKTVVNTSQSWQGGGSFKYYHLGASIIAIDKETGKGEFNWILGKKFIQDSLLMSYDFVIHNEVNLFPNQLFLADKEKPTLGKLTGKNGLSIYGLASLADPNDKNLTITNEEVKTIYSSLKKQHDFQSLIIFTNKGIDIASDSIPTDMEITKVPNAVFTELER